MMIYKHNYDVCCLAKEWLETGQYCRKWTMITGVDDLLASIRLPLPFLSSCPLEASRTLLPFNLMFAVECLLLLTFV